MLGIPHLLKQSKGLSKIVDDIDIDEWKKVSKKLRDITEKKSVTHG